MAQCKSAKMEDAKEETSVPCERAAQGRSGKVLAGQLSNSGMRESGGWLSFVCSAHRELDACDHDELRGRKGPREIVSMWHSQGGGSPAPRRVLDRAVLAEQVAEAMETTLVLENASWLSLTRSAGATRGSDGRVARGGGRANRQGEQGRRRAGPQKKRVQHETLLVECRNAPPVATAKMRTEKKSTNNQAEEQAAARQQKSLAKFTSVRNVAALGSQSHAVTPSSLRSARQKE